MKVIVSTCDEYNWVLPVFFRFYKKAWPTNPYQAEIITEKEHVPGKAFYTGRHSWSHGMLSYLRQSKSSKFMLILEDYILKSVDAQRVKTAERLCTGNVGCVRLSNHPNKYFNQHTSGVPPENGFKQYPNAMRFSAAMQISIYQKDFLFDLLRAKENIWQAEANGVKRLVALKDKWRILWPEKNIMEYEPLGLVKKGQLVVKTLRWSKANMPKTCKEYKILQDRIKWQSDNK